MREFRPPVRPSTFRLVLAVLLPVLVIVPMIAVASIILGISQATYTIGEGAVQVRSGDFFAGDRSLKIADLVEARVLVLQGGRRTAGTALPGYCAGRFSYPDLGAVWQVTDCRRRVLLLRASAGEAPVLISPPDPEAFLASIRAGTPTQVALPPPDKGPVRALLLVLAPVAVIASGLVSALMLLGPSRMRYLVGDGAFEVRTLFGRKRWPTAGAQAKAHTPSGLRRVAGTGAPGYYTGVFRESGQTTRVYATDVTRVVLFEGQARVIVSPEDPVEFLRALEAEGVVVQHHA